MQVLAPQARAARPPPAEPAAEPEQPLPHPELRQSPWARPSRSAASRSRQAWPPQLRHATWLPTRLQPRQDGPRPRYGCQGTPDPKASDNEEVALQQRRRRVLPAGPRRRLSSCLRPLPTRREVDAEQNPTLTLPHQALQPLRSRRHLDCKPRLAPSPRRTLPLPCLPHPLHR